MASLLGIDCICGGQGEMWEARQNPSQTTAGQLGRANHAKWLVWSQPLERLLKSPGHRRRLLEWTRSSSSGCVDGFRRAWNTYGPFWASGFGPCSGRAEHRAWTGGQDGWSKETVQPRQEGSKGASHQGRSGGVGLSANVERLLTTPAEDKIKEKVRASLKTRLGLRFATPSPMVLAFAGQWSLVQLACRRWSGLISVNTVCRQVTETLIALKGDDGPSKQSLPCQPGFRLKREWAVGFGFCMCFGV